MLVENQTLLNQSIIAEDSKGWGEENWNLSVQPTTSNILSKLCGRAAL